MKTNSDNVNALVTIKNVKYPIEIQQVYSDVFSTFYAGTIYLEEKIDFTYIIGENYYELSSSFNPAKIPSSIKSAILQAVTNYC